MPGVIRFVSISSIRKVRSNVASELLGRTNRAFPPVWLGLRVPQNSSDIEPLVASAIESNVPIDVTSQPGLWGNYIDNQDAFMTYIGSSSFENAPTDRHACDEVQADLLQTLSALGRDRLGIYFLRLRRSVEESQISGALEALEMARQEGHVAYVGLCCDGPGFASLGMWQFHDAFEVIMVPRNAYDDSTYKTLAPLAHERRVGLITSHPFDWSYGVDVDVLPGPWRLRNLCKSFYSQTLRQAIIGDLAQDHPVLVPVSNSREVQEAIAAPLKTRPQGIAEFLEPFREAYEDPKEWAQLASSDDPALRKAALRWNADHALANPEAGIR